MSLEEFVDYHKNHHAPLFCSIPEVELYVRKYVVNHPIVAEGFPKPIYDAVVEISFDSFEDFNSFFTSENYLTKVHPDEPNFFDNTNYVAMATNETIIKANAQLTTISRGILLNYKGDKFNLLYLSKKNK